MNEIESRMVVFDERIEQLEQAVDELTTHVLSLEKIMTGIADIIAPDALQDEQSEEK